MPTPGVTPFATRSTRWFVAVTLLSLAAAAWLLVSPDIDRPYGSIDADGYSKSAIGHFGLLRLLREEHESCMQSRMVAGSAIGGLLVVAEPSQLLRSDDERMKSLVADAPAMLVVLPKREAVADPEKPEWAERIDVLEASRVADVLGHVARWADERPPELLRISFTGAWRLPEGWPQPTLASPCQLLAAKHTGLEPLVACDQGVLLGRLGDLWVLSDPDLIANHGLPRGDNARFVLAMLRHLRKDGAIVFDETLHGHRLDPSIWQAAGRFPFVLVSVHLLLLLALVASTARGRFGPELPPAPAIGAGKQFLIDNVAALLRRAGLPGPSLRRYGRQRVHRLAEALRAPRGLGDSACRAWVLARLPEAKREALAAALQRVGTHVTAGEAVALARRIRILTEGALHAGSRDR